MSSYRGLAADSENLYVTAVRRRGGGTASARRFGNLAQRQHQRRGLTAPVETATSLVVGDYQGYLHWLDKGTGFLVARERVAKYRVAAAGRGRRHDRGHDDDGKMAAYRADPANATAPHPIRCRRRRNLPSRTRKAGRTAQVRAWPMLPVLALIGRPNVGKSTLFNAMTGTRDALVADLPGLTRDRQYGFARRTDVPCIVVDTGGLVENAESIESLMVAQTERAIAEADRLIVLVDGRAGVTPQDQFVARLARRSGKPVLLAVNKTEGFDHDIAVADFHQLGLGEPHADIRGARSGCDLAARGGPRGPDARST